MIYNALTIDVEDYYMVSAFADVIKFEDWHNYESRVEKNTYKILDLLDKYGVKATFFVLGWVAENHPKLIRDIHTAGHEIASHGYNHRLIYNLTPHEFKEDVRITKSILENIIGFPVIGYRAASYSIVKKTFWALDILIEEGFLYDSSIFPIHHDLYGIPDAERYPHKIDRPSGVIVEFPLSTLKLRISHFEFRIPIAGGGYLRLLPLHFIRTAIKRINEKEKKPIILYFHPWEVDIYQPKINGRFLSRLRHYINLKSTVPKLNILLSEFRFKPLSEFLESS